jgi:hypothetical protein
MDEQVVVFPDTNMFLHFKSFDQIPWPKELGCSSVCLRIAHVVIDELNQKKDTHPAEHIRDRAQKTLSKIRKVFFGQGGRVNGSVQLVCETAGTGLDMGARRLDPASNDDCILAAALEYQEAHAGERVVLITDDSGFALRAYGYELATGELSPKLKIPAQQDPRRKEIEELKQRIREAEKGLPHLNLAFVGGNDRIEQPVYPEIAPSIEGARAYVTDHIAPQFQQETVAWREMAAAEQPQLPDTAAAILETVSLVRNMFVDRRNAANAAYLEQFVQYVFEVWNHGNDMARTRELRLRLQNNGTIPASDVNLVLQFPKTVSVFLLGVPPAPRPPLRPGQPTIPAAPQQASIPAAPGGVRLVRGSDTGDSFEARYHIPKLNHHLDEQFGLHIRFVSYEAAASFTIKYRIAAVNAPEAVTGSLHVVAKKPQPGQRRLARRQRRPQ